MTINSETRVAGPFEGNDSTVAFPFAFKVFDSDDVLVVRATGAVETVLTLGADYSVALNPDQNASPGGVVTLLLGALATDSTLTLTSDLEFLQPLDLTNQGGFYPRVINNAFDRATILLQQLAAIVSRTLKFPLSDGPVGDLPGRSARAGRVLAFDPATAEPVAGPTIYEVETVAATNEAIAIVASNIDDVVTVADNISDVTNFADVYHGPSATDPATRKDGSPLQAGDLYFNTFLNSLRTYNGAQWVGTPSGLVTVQNLSGDGVETEFLLNYAPESEIITQVYISGVYQQKNTYSLGGVGGATLIFDEAPPAGTDNIEIVVSSLTPSDDVLRQDLANSTDQEKGASLIGYSGRNAASIFGEMVNVKNYGASGDGVTDDTAAILAAVTDLSNPSSNVLYFPYGTYRTSQTIEIPQAANTLCAPGVVFQRFGSAPKNFPAIIVNGGGREHYLGLFDSYGDGIVIRNSTNRVRFQRISNCDRGLVISAISASNLDNKVDGLQIGLCTDAIVFEQSGNRVQQGNEVRVNFVSESLNTLVFDDLGTHVEQSDWDSNLVELMASDPFYKAGATLCLNRSAFSVPALDYSIKSWAGGWNINDGTITAISGSFSASVFEFSFAAQISANDLVLSGASRTSSDSCQFRLARASNMGSGTAVPAVAINTTFNGGIDLQSKRFRLACTYPALASGQSTRTCFRHILAQTSFGGRFKIVSVEANGVPLIFNIRNSGGESHGWASIWAYNPSASTVASNTYNIIVEAGD